MSSIANSTIKVAITIDIVARVEQNKYQEVV